MKASVSYHDLKLIAWKIIFMPLKDLLLLESGFKHFLVIYNILFSFCLLIFKELSPPLPIKRTASSYKSQTRTDIKGFLEKKFNSSFVIVIIASLVLWVMREKGESWVNNGRGWAFADLACSGTALALLAPVPEPLSTLLCHGQGPLWSGDPLLLPALWEPPHWGPLTAAYSPDTLGAQGKVSPPDVSDSSTLTLLALTLFKLLPK